MSDDATISDLDFTAYLAGRKEADKAPVTVKVGDRVLSFTPWRTARPLLDIAVTGDELIFNRVVSQFYKDSLSEDDYAYIQGLADNLAESGFDQDAYHTLYRQVIEAVAGRPTSAA